MAWETGNTSYSERLGPVDELEEHRAACMNSLGCSVEDGEQRSGLSPVSCLERWQWWDRSLASGRKMEERRGWLGTYTRGAWDGLEEGRSLWRVRCQATRQAMASSSTTTTAHGDVMSARRVSRALTRWAGP
jgi:hypothetical protein